MLTEADDRMIRINACGPFPHGYYQIGETRLSHEGPLEGRADLLLATAREHLLGVQAGRDRDANSLSILEVGSYDGWIANHLWHDGYRNITTLEPREQNVSRGVRLRELLGIEDGVRHFVGDLTSMSEPPGAPFDVVMSFGVVHHLDDIAGFLRTLRSLCEGSLLLECLTLSDELVGAELLNAIEPKDLAYRSAPGRVSQIGVKLESHYYPGSAAEAGVVFVPGRQALVWMIESAGFEIVSVRESWVAQTTRERLAHREHVAATIVEARPVLGTVLDYSSEVLSSEHDACFVCIPPATLRLVSEAVQRNPRPQDARLHADLEQLAAGQAPDVAALIRAIVHAPSTKLRFEQAKAACELGDRHSAIVGFQAIVSEPSDDWRSVYRSFARLSEIDHASHSYWMDRLWESNPEFPQEILSRGDAPTSL